LNSLEMTGFFSPKPVKIKGYLLKAKKDGPAPAAVLAPACNGLLLPKSKKIRPYYRNMAKFLNDGGMTVLLVDGFNPRGHEEICTEPGKSRTIDTEVRMKDIIGGLYYMRSSPDVLGNKIFLVTWGATGSLQVMNKESPYYDKIHPGFAGAIMFYPECAHMDNRFAPYAPIQMYVGELDTWNPAAACKALAKRQEPGSASFNIKIYPKTYHAFDQMREPALRTDLAVGPVIIGGNPESAADAYKTTAEFLSKFIEFSNVPVQGAK
jgi:dienelactone hydrolase